MLATIPDAAILACDAYQLTATFTTNMNFNLSAGSYHNAIIGVFSKLGYKCRRLGI